MEDYSKALDYMKATQRAIEVYNDNLTVSFQLTQAEMWPNLLQLITINYWEEALEITENMFESDHYQIARYCYMLGQALEYNCQYAFAKVQYENAMKNLEKQEISHPSLKKYYIKNLAAVKNKLKIS